MKAIKPLFLLSILSVLPLAGMAEKPAIIPQPVSMEMHKGVFKMSPKTDILVCENTRELGKQLQSHIHEQSGHKLSLKSEKTSDPRNPTILIQTSDSLDFLGEEGYLLDVSKFRVHLRSYKPQGAFYGLQTLRQLLFPAPDIVSDWRIPSMSIVDKPRFEWRGMHLDVGRHFFPVSFIKRYIDLMAFHKMNTFHWHLTEDQGWRIEIKKYPKLTETGSKRASTPIPSDRKKSDGEPYEGYYTQDEIREVVAYAADRHITVIPEIEMPGHSTAALASYPELGCTGGPYEVSTTWGVKKEVYCAGNEKVFEFLENVLLEVMELFPSEIIHIGGDECPKDRWEKCPKCQARIQEEGLADEKELQSYFIQRMEKFLNKHDRKIIGWDEILEGGLAPNASVMSWRGMEGGIRAARMGHDVVMTPTSHCYFDYYQSEDREKEPPAFDAYLPLETVYAFDPVPGELNEKKAAHILGAQGNVWTEYINSTNQVEYMAYPRGTALSEVLWSPAGQKDYEDFLKRLRSFLQHLDQRDVHYRDPY